MKLSKLQRWILTRASETPDASPHSRCHLQTARILNEFYCFPKTNKGIYSFHPGTLDQGKFNAAKAAVSRSFKRLNERGLVDIVYGWSRWTGIALTVKGKEKVNALSDSDKELTEHHGGEI